MPAGFLRRLFAGDIGRSVEPELKSVEKKEKQVEAKTLPPFEVASRTEASTDHPDVNQDAFAVDAARQMLMVADGVGGSARGEVASRAAQEAMGVYDIYLDELIDQECKATGLPYLTVEQASRVMDTHFRLIADFVSDAVDRISGWDTKAAATTLATAKVFETAPGELFAVVKSVGDTYPMVRRADGTVEMVDIEEDGVVQSWVKKGEVTEDELFLISESGSLQELETEYTKYAAEQAIPVEAGKLEILKSKFNNYFGNGSNRQARSEITQHVGRGSSDELRVHSAVVKVNPGDQLFFSTDGIDALRRRQIQELLSGEGTVAEKTKRLVDAATEANTVEKIRSKPDDITVVGMQIPEAALTREQTQVVRLAEAKRVQTEDLVKAEMARQKAMDRANALE